MQRSDEVKSGGRSFVKFSTSADQIVGEAEPNVEVIPPELSPKQAYMKFGVDKVRTDALEYARNGLSDRADELRGLTLDRLDADLTCREIMYPVWNIEYEINGRVMKHVVSGVDGSKKLSLDPTWVEEDGGGEDRRPIGKIGWLVFADSLAYLFLLIMWIVRKIAGVGPDLPYTAVALVGSFMCFGGDLADKGNLNYPRSLRVIGSCQILFWCFYLIAPLASAICWLVFDAPMLTLTEGAICIVPVLVIIAVKDLLNKKRHAAPIARIRARMIELCK